VPFQLIRLGSRSPHATRTRAGCGRLERKPPAQPYTAYVTRALTEWVEMVFGQAIPGQYGVPRLEVICGPDEHTLGRLTEVFESPSLLRPYSDAVLERAFWDISERCTIQPLTGASATALSAPSKRSFGSSLPVAVPQC
jgi:hypothetical protein